jgi:hypothetical protein
VQKVLFEMPISVKQTNVVRGSDLVCKNLEVSAHLPFWNAPTVCLSLLKLSEDEPTMLTFANIFRPVFEKPQ